MQDDNMCLKYGWQHGDIGNIVNKNTSTQIIYVTYTVDGRNPLPKKGSSSKYIQTWGAVQLQPISDAKKNVKQRRKQLDMSRWHPSKTNPDNMFFSRFTWAILRVYFMFYWMLFLLHQHSHQTTKKIQKKHPCIPILTIHPLCFSHLRGTIAIYTIQLWPWLARWWSMGHGVDFHGDNFSKGGPTIGFG